MAPPAERRRPPASGTSTPTAADWLPLTEAQSGLWYAQQLAPSNPVFNVAHAIDIEGPLDLGLFEKAVNRAAKEAESLALQIVDHTA